MSADQPCPIRIAAKNERGCSSMAEQELPEALDGGSISLTGSMPAQTSRLPRRDRRSRDQRLRKGQNMTNHQEAFDGDRLLAETDWLAANLDAPDLRILDCTVFLTPDPAGGTRAESGHAKWQEAHIPGSAFADVLGALSDPDAEYRCHPASGRSLCRSDECAWRR